jgi:hypothetical protein
VQREAFERYLSLPPHTLNRFSKPPTDERDLDNQSFQDAVSGNGCRSRATSLCVQMLISINSATGQSLDHAGAHAYLKQKLSPSALKK